MLNIMDISGSALLAQRTRLDTIAQNVAHSKTTRDEEGRLSPFQRRYVIFRQGQEGNEQAPGVHAIVMKSSAYRIELDKGHPDADVDGYVKYPDIDLAVEYVNAIEASRTYEANVTAIEVSKAMLNSSLRILA
jgi:flagellar basal-body rod protein FlgC